MEVHEITSIKIFEADLFDLQLSIPFWEKIARRPGWEGFVRDGVARAESRMPSEYKVPYTQHAEPLLAMGHQRFILIGARNLQQNLLMPVFHTMRQPKLLRRRDEPWKTATYWALVRFRAGRFALEQVRFRATGNTQDPDVIEIRRGDTWQPEDVLFAATGQPLVWDDRPTPLHHVAALCYDLRHVWRLHWESHLHCPADAQIHAELMGTFMECLHQPFEERATALQHVAAQHNLKVEDGFYHSSLGVDGQGNLILIAMHGSLHDVARVLIENGASRGIMMDQGGSVGYALWSARTGGPTYIATGSYFRPQGHSLLAAILNEDFVDPPFRPRPEFDPLSMTVGTRAGRAMLDDLEYEIRRRADGSCRVYYDDPFGRQEEDLPLPPTYAERQLREAFCHFAAVWIYNHAVLWGTRTIHIAANPEFVDAVRQTFSERFDKVDPGTDWESGSITDYLSVYNDYPFSIEVRRDLVTGQAESTPKPSPKADQHTDIVVGLDIGSGSVKLAVCCGEKPILQTVFPTRPDKGSATTTYLLDNITDRILAACTKSKISLTQVEAIGVAWPGATRGKTIDATSNLLREMEDLWLSEPPETPGLHNRLDPEKVERFRHLDKLIAKRLNNTTEVFLINDGVADAWYLANRRGLRRAIEIKIGTSIAGGYIDAEGRCEYLTELGRFCLDLDLQAQPHPFTKITGLARELIATVALVRLTEAAGLTEFKGIKIDPQNAGLIAHNILSSEGNLAAKRVVRDALGQMGEALGHLIRVLCRHLPVDHIVVSGGLASERSRAADILVATAQGVLEISSPLLTFQRISSTEDELPEADRFIGAVATAAYALFRVRY